ncbi:MAG: TetR/AcrR family transcriptional regulator [Desulfobacterales bacterium]|nr:TetR/AcrR family transcriptional regulator [Desulfobacterales bacterium]
MTCQSASVLLGLMARDLSAFKKEKEEAILEAALKIIKEKGFHRARMSDIAREANISYGLVYHYFKTKDDLFEAILYRWWDSLFQLMKDINEDQSDVQMKLRHIIDYFLDTYQDNPALVNIFITEISRSTSNLTADRLEYFKKFMSLTEAIIAEGQRNETLRKDFKARYLTYIFLGALEAFISTMVLADQNIKGNAQKKRIVESILEVFLNGAKSQKDDS